MADRSWTRRVTQAAASTARDRVRDTVGRGTVLARGAAGGLVDAGAALPDLMTHIDGPRLPLGETWSMGLGKILSGHPGLPQSLHGVVGRLDCLGCLQISPDAISFDGETVPWEKVEEIEFGPVLDVVTSHALQREAKRLSALLPAVPGRGWLVRQGLEVLVGLCLAVAGPKCDDALVGGAPDDDAAAGVPVSVVHRGLARRKRLTPGVFAALVAARTPAVCEAIVAIAQERDIKITVAPPPRSRKQALAIRRMVETMPGRIARTGPAVGIKGADDEGAD